MESPHRHRIFLLVLSVLAMATVVSARLYQLQVDQCDDLRARAIRQQQDTITVPATRGSILDREGRVLATSVATLALYAHPNRVDDPRAAAELLAPLISLPRREIETRLASGKSFAYLDRFVGPETADAIRSAGVELDGTGPLGFLDSSRRTYPGGKLAAHVVGVASIDGEGLEGIEKHFDAELSGDPTVYRIVQDGRRGRLSQVAVTSPDEPRDVVLTLDVELQHIAERELERVMRETGAEAASAVLVDPASGHILALANRPAADLNAFGRAAAAARVNRAIVHQFEPGSTFKIVAMAAALESGKLRPNQLFDCENGTFQTGWRTIHDDTPHRLLTASQIMHRSSNIGMVKIARQLGAPALHEACVRFGFGQDTGVELPGEHRGALRSIDRWSGFSLDSIAFGQEIGVTVLQMASAFATLANGGVRMPPRLAHATIGADGTRERLPDRPGRRILETRTVRELTAMLEGVVVRGTGKQAGISGYRVAGKTGTAQKIVGGSYSDTDFVASFGGFAPLPSPALAGLVVIDSPDGDATHGGQVAAPAFRRIMAAALAHLRVPAQDTFPMIEDVVETPSERFVSQRPAPLPSRPVVSAGRVPDLIGLSLREAVIRLAASGYTADVHGRGFVRRQHPRPGTRLDPGRVCRVELDDRVASSAGSRAPGDAGRPR